MELLQREVFPLGMAPFIRLTVRGQEDGRRRSWPSIVDAAREFDVRVLEAEALWGPEVRARSMVLRRCLGELDAAVVADVDNLRGLVQQTDEHVIWRREIARIVDSIGAENPFTAKVEDAVTGLNDLLKPHLRWSERAPT